MNNLLADGLGFAAVVAAFLLGVAAITFAYSYQQKSDIQICLAQNSPEECKIFILKDK